MSNDAGALPRVLFIAGMGRSGSTVLERVIGSAPGCVAVGELRYLWTLGYGEDQLCGCGERFSGCPFWRDVMARAFEGEAVDPGEMARSQERLLRMRWAPGIAAGRVPGAVRADFAQFVAFRERLYAAITAVSGASLVVDSSKFPPYGAALQRVPGLDVRTVHLVRDSRAVAFSVGRQQRDPAAEGRRAYRYSRSARTSAVNWMALNALTEALWLRRRGYLRVRYEEFAAQPAETAARVLAFAGVAERPCGEGGTFETGVQHTIAGNPMRMERGPLTVRADDAWRAEMGKGARRTVTALTWPVLLRYGYRPWGGR